MGEKSRRSRKWLVWVTLVLVGAALIGAACCEDDARTPSDIDDGARPSGKYADEEIKSEYTYPKEYKGPKPIADQIKIIAVDFGLDPSDALEYARNLPKLPDGAEGWFAIPSVDALAKKHFPEVTDPAERYCRAVLLVLEKIADSRFVYAYCIKRHLFEPEHLRVNARTQRALDSISRTQKGDILIIAAQFGLRHRGRSVRRAREVFLDNEFGLGTFAVGAMLVSHPERIVSKYQLLVNCPGDEFSLRAYLAISGSLYFVFSPDYGMLDICTDSSDNVGRRYGSASAFFSI